MRREPSQDRTSFHHRDARTYTHSDWDNLDMPFNLMCTSLECGEKLECLEKIHADLGRTQWLIQTKGRLSSSWIVQL